MRIDVHTHYVPRAFWAGTEAGGAWYGATLSEAGGRQFVTSGPRRAGPVTPEWRFTAEERLRYMDSVGIDVHVVSTGPMFFNYHLPLADAQVTCRTINEEIAALVRYAPSRFAGLAALPAQDAGAAVAELEYAMGTLGLKGAELNCNVMGKNWDDPDLQPIFAAAERLGAFLFFHPNDPPGADRLARYYLGNLIGFPVDTTIAVASVIMGGVLDRHPGLKLCFAHGGGYSCWAAGRWDHGYTVRPEPKVNIMRLPSSYLRGLYYDTLVHNHATLRYLADTVTPDNIFLASDWPFDMGPADPAGWFLAGAGFTAEEQEKILGGNAQRVLGLTAR